MEEEIIQRLKDTYLSQFTDEEYANLSDITIRLEKILHYYPIEEMLDAMRGVR